MSAKKKPPKDCRQRGVCKHYESCPWQHDANKCRAADTTADEALVFEVD